MLVSLVAMWPIVACNALTKQLYAVIFGGLHPDSTCTGLAELKTMPKSIKFIRVKKQQ